MKTTRLRALLGLHRLGLRLYPRPFRAEFEAEMQAVFAAALAEAALGGLGAVARLLTREWGTAPRQIVIEHWSAARSGPAAGGAVQAEAGMATRTLARGLAATLVTLLVLAPFVFWLWWLFGRSANLGVLLPGLLCLLPLAGGWAWALSPAVRRLGAGPWLAVGMLCAAGLLVPTAQLVGHELDAWPAAVRTLVFCLPAAALIVSALLLAVSLEAQPRQWPAVAGLGLAALLTLMVFGNLYWLLVWDLTYDPLGLLWLLPEALAAVLGGALLALGLPGRRKWAGLYGVALLAGLTGLWAHTQTLDFRALTTARGQTVAQSLAAYQARTGHYPAALNDLGWWANLTRPTPVSINGQSWCYQSDGAAYQLGYVDRPHWSSPELFGQQVAGAAALPGAAPLCAAEIEALGQPRPAVIDTSGWPWAGAGLLAQIQPGQTRAQALAAATEVWHRDSCVPERAPGAAYAYVDVLWTGTSNVQQATVIAVTYAWDQGGRQWVVDHAERVPRADLYALFAACSSLDLTPLAAP